MLECDRPETSYYCLYISLWEFWSSKWQIWPCWVGLNYRISHCVRVLLTFIIYNIKGTGCILFKNSLKVWKSTCKRKTFVKSVRIRQRSSAGFGEEPPRFDAGCKEDLCWPIISSMGGRSYQANYQQPISIPPLQFCSNNVDATFVIVYFSP